MSKVLIFGAQGNLGSQLVKIFSADSQYDVIGWDKSEIDITDRELIMKKVGDIKPGIIINAAAYNAVDKCEDNDLEYDLAKRLNIDAPRYLAEAAMSVRAILVNYSTDYVFGGDNEKGYKENDTPAPINRYGKTKFHGEKQLIQYSGSGLKWFLIRTSKLFGPKGDSEFSKPGFFDIMLKLAQEKDSLDVVDEEVSCFTYTPDLAKATKELVESGKGYGIYHLVNSKPCTWYQATRYLFKAVGIKVKINPITSDGLVRPAKRPKFSVLKNTKFTKLRDWREALSEYLVESHKIVK